MPPNTIKVDRSTKWGNPFIVGVDGTGARCVELFELMLAGWICLSRVPELPDAQLAYVKMARRDRRHLRGKNLACLCPLDQPCHADILLRIKQKKLPLLSQDKGTLEAQQRAGERW